MFKSARLIEILFLLIFITHTCAIIQTNSATSLGGASVGTVSRIGLNGNSEFLTSLGNAKVGSYHKQQYPIAQIPFVQYVPIPFPYAIPYGLRLSQRPLRVPVTKIISQVKPGPKPKPSYTLPKPSYPQPKPGKITGRNSGPVVSNTNQLLGLELGGLLGGIFQGGGSGGSGLLGTGLLGGGGGGLLGGGLLGR